MQLQAERNAKIIRLSATLTREQIARQLGITYWAVGGVLARARSRAIRAERKDAGLCRKRNIEIIELAVAGELSQQEIARKLGVTKGAVAGVLYRASDQNRYVRPCDREFAVPWVWRPPEREPNTCCMIDGNPPEPGWRWCGKPVRRSGESWCAEHHKIVWVRQ